MRTHGALTEPSVSRVVRTHDRKGREGKGVGGEGINAEVVIHPQVEGDHLTAVSFPAMNELQR